MTSRTMRVLVSVGVVAILVRMIWQAEVQRSFSRYRTQNGGELTDR